MPNALGRAGDGLDVLEALRRMMLIRVFETEVASLARRGEVRGAIHSSIGQEATYVGACMAVDRNDAMTGNHRSHGHPIAKGAAIDRLMAELMGRSTGVCHGNGGSMHLADFSVGSLGESAVVGSSIAIATGAGLANQYQENGRVCLAFFGDGAVNTGIFHESLNLAGAWKLPVVYLCENNGYAVSTPNRTVSAVESVAERAAAYSVPGQRVDGQQVREVYAAVADAAERARTGGGASIVEAMTYRYEEHSLGLTGALGGYRDPAEVERWTARDPIGLFAAELVDDGRLDAIEVERMWAEAESAVADAVAFARASPYPEPGQLWSDMYADPAPFANEERLA